MKGSECTLEHEVNMKEKWKDMNTNEKKMKGNKCKMKATLVVAEAPETNKTTPWSISKPV